MLKLKCAQSRPHLFSTATEELDPFDVYSHKRSHLSNRFKTNKQTKKVELHSSTSQLHHFPLLALCVGYHQDVSSLLFSPARSWYDPGLIYDGQTPETSPSHTPACLWCTPWEGQNNILQSWTISKKHWNIQSLSEVLVISSAVQS